ncbi:MAG: head-tail connector protein [Prevotella sp.]|nr:head-tail connector protein [Prevotella sp.]
MKQVRLSGVGLDDVKNYIRVTDHEDDKLIGDIISAARGYIFSYTGLTADEADEFPEAVIALMCLCADMYDVRTAAVGSEKENPIVRNILNMHRKNLVV